jgi:hypothetical protein
MVNVAGETSRAVHCDEPRLIPRFIQYLDFAGLDHEELELTIAAVIEGLAGAKLPRRCARITPELRDLLFAQLRECDCLQALFRHENLSLLAERLEVNFCWHPDQAQWNKPPCEQAVPET